MTIYKQLILFSLFIFSVTVAISFSPDKNPIDDKIISYVVDTKSQDIDFYWKDDSSKIIRSIQNLKTYVERKDLNLMFAMNGGMFDSNYAPVGLFIQQFETLKGLDSSSNTGNFYMKPNGIFYITSNNMAVVCKTENFTDNGQIKYATQSGPMLVIDGEIHPQFKDGSTNLQIRNGVGILPDNNVVFVISTAKVNFYDFASYFKSLGCRNALYLDGFVSRMYLPEKHLNPMDGDFGVIIGITQAARE